MIYDEWVFHDVEHIYLQLIKKIKCAIYSGQLSAGEKIPSVREMAKKREDTAKVLCFSYFDNMFALDFPKMKQKISDQKMPEKPKTKRQEASL